jgi:hypothetical protein
MVKKINFDYNLAKISGTLYEDLSVRMTGLVTSGIMVGVDIIDKDSNRYYCASFLHVIFTMPNQGTKACRRNA